MFRRFLIISLVWVVGHFCLSCATRKYESPVYGMELAETLSSRLGMPLAPSDNLDLYDQVAQWIGTPHRIGMSTKKGTDCSGFVTNVYRSVYGKKLERSSSDMLKVNCDRIKKQELCEGDLVFFYTGKNPQRISHVGIYLKDGKFAHSSTSNGVIISSLSEPYYKKRWIAGGVVK